MRSEVKNPSQIGQRMKRNYEDISRVYLPRRTYTIIRVDGRAFHTWTRGLKEPFDHTFMSMLNQVAIKMCEDIQGCKLAFLQSDEISLLLTDFDTLQTEAWFGGEIRKIVGISAGIASAWMTRFYPDKPPAVFDGRAFTIPSRTEVINYLIWRQQDASRNSIQMVAQSLYSHKQLHKKNCDEMQEMIHQKGQNWNDFPASCKRGRVVRPTKRMGEVEWVHKKTGEKQTAEVERTVWISEAPPIFTQDREYLAALVPDVP